MKIGFIGLGIMGKPMAKHLLAGGYSVTVHNRSRAAVDELVALGASNGHSPKQTAEVSDIIITMLPDSPDVEQVILGSNGVIEGVREGNIVVDMSSINPLTAKHIAEQLLAKGVHMLDAPVSGGEIGAIEGKLAIMVGGPEPIFTAVKPVFEKMGTTITHVGEIGAGNVVKLVNQIIVAVNIAAISEGLAFGKKAGIDPTVVYEAIRGGLAGSRVLDTKIGNVANEIFKPGFRVDLHAKDLNNAVSMNEQINAHLPFTEQILNLFHKLSGQGYGNEDHSGLYRLFAHKSDR